MTQVGNSFYFAIHIKQKGNFQYYEVQKVQLFGLYFVKNEKISF